MIPKKAIILAGGSGTRLRPSTHCLSKQLLPVYDKPMIYYALSTIMLSGLNDILIITTPSDKPLYEKLLGDGSQWGIRLTFIEQPLPGGIAQALLIGEDFIDNQPVALALGDNILYGQSLGPTLQQACQQNQGATVFAYYVKDPERYGVVEFDDEGKPAALVEKPKKPESPYAITGLYFYDNNAVELAKQLTPSKRGELEITDLNQIYLERGELTVHRFARGFAWLDTGTPDALADAARFVQILEQRQGLKICCPEEIAWRLNYINDNQLITLANEIGHSYGEYLLSLIDSEKRIIN